MQEHPQYIQIISGGICVQEHPQYIQIISGDICVQEHPQYFRILNTAGMCGTYRNETECILINVMHLN